MEAVEQATKNASNTTKQMITTANGNTIALNKMTIGAKLASVAMNALSVAGNMIAMWAITKGIELLVNWIDELVLTSEEAKEKLATTESELESVNQQIEELNQQIKTLESLETPSITDKEDLERLKAENEELRIRQRYLEKQKQNDEKDVSDTAKHDYKVKYGSTSREDIDNRKNALSNPVSSGGTASSYLTGNATASTTPYAAGQQAQSDAEYDKLADLIAQYELYSEKKKEAIANDDAESLAKYNEKLGDVETELMDCRTELQGYADDMALTGNSQDLENVKGDLALIDETLFSAGERLVDYVNNTLNATDTEKLTELAQNGELTADVLKKNFSEVDEYLKKNGLTLEDLISILDIYKEELEDIPNKTGILNIEELNKNINISLDAISKSYDAVEKFKTAMSDGMTDDALNAVAGLSDELKAMVAEFYAGTISADELFKALTDHYSNDLENYSKAIIEKNKYSEEFYNKVGLADSKFVNYMLENYKVDLTNCKDYNTARLEIEKQTLGKLGDMWGKYYDAQTDAYKPQLEKLANSAYGAARAGVADKDNTALQLYKQITEQVSAYRKAKEEIDKITYEGISSSFEGNSSNFGGNSSLSSKAKETEKTFDHIATKLEKLSDELSDLDKKVSNTYSTWTDRNKALTESINKTKEAINLQNQAYQAYIREANAVGLSDTYKRLVQNGSMDISVIKDDSLADKITKYQDYYGKAQDVLKTVSELQDTLNELSSTEKWELFKSESDADISELDAYLDKVQNVLDKAELQGKFANSSAYTDIYNLTSNKITVLKGQAEQLSSILGTMTQGTEAYDELFNELLSIQNEIADLENECIEFNNNIRNLDWEVFEYLEDSISRITDEMDYLIDLVANEDLFDDKGNRTKYGDATIALHAANYDVYKQQAQDYKQEILELQKELANGNMEVLDQYNKIVDLHRDAINSANDEKEAILDLISQGYESQKDALQDVIDKKKESLNLEKESIDYQKTISNLVKERDSLKKQKLAYQNDSSESGRMNLQQIEAKLTDVNDEIEQTEYEKYLSDTEKMLDVLMLDYEAFQNERLDNSDELLNQIIGNLQTEGDEINATLKEVADANGTLISGSITSIFDANSPFTSGLTSISDGVAGTTNAINNLIAQVSSIAGILTSTNAGTNDTNKGSTGSNKPITNNTEKQQQPTTTTVSNTNKQQTAQKVESKPSGSDIFIYKKDSYPKDRLNTETSIVDRLKKFNFDSSFQARATYYSKLGGSGTYKGSASQNIWMIKKMKEMGYKKGSSNIPYDQMNWVHDGEIILKRASDGGYLTELTSGSKVLNAKQVENLLDLSNINPSLFMPNVNLPKIPNMQSKSAPSNSIGDVQVNIELPNVQSYEDFMTKAQNDTRFEGMIQHIAFSKNPMDKYKYKWK